MKEQKLYAYSQIMFDMIATDNGWNINFPENVAIISICDVDCSNHLFKENNKHILNVDFNDVSENEENFIDDNTAKTIVDFIDNNIDNDFYIHCSAGKSRSQAVVRYILDIYQFNNWTIRYSNPCITPNIDILCKLKRIKYEKEGLFLNKLEAE